MALKKINYNGSSKVILRLCEMVNQLIDGGGGGSTVTYTQTLSSGTKTGSISIDGVSTDMYAPTPPTNVSDLTNDAGYLTSSDVSAVAMSGDYSDLSNTPTLGTAAAENVGVANGVAELDANGKVPSSQLPSYVDDVIEGYYDSITDRFYEESTFTTVIPPESGKSWVDIPSNKSYRWTGSVYTRVDEGVQLGETSSTAYRGDRGKTAYDHSQSDHSTITPAFTEASTRANIATGESIATIFGKIKKFFTDLKTVAFSGSYNDLSDTPTIPDELADLSDDSTHRLVTDTEKSTWNGKSDFSGSYNDLTDKPTIPTVNDGTLTIQQNGTTLGTFTANQSGNTIVDITGGGSSYTEGDGIDISAQNVISVDTTFTEASTRTNIASGDTFATILGKIKKFFTDLKTVAFSGSADDVAYDSNTTIKSAVDGKVSKSGDTMTGSLEIHSTAQNQLRVYKTHDSTSSTASDVAIGNNIPTGTAGNSYGRLIIFGTRDKYSIIRSDAKDDNREIWLPDKAGTIALKDRTNYTYTLASGFEDVAATTHWLYERNGNIHLHCNIYHSTGYTAGVYTYPITLPVGARPSATVYAACTFLAYAVTAGNERGVPGFVKINSNGNVTAMPIQSMTGISDVLIIDIVFPVD